MTDISIAHVNEETVKLSDWIRSLAVSNQFEIVERLVRRCLIRQLALGEGIEIKNEELQRAVDEWRYKHRLERSEFTKAWLNRQGITFDDVVIEIEYELIKKKLVKIKTEDRIQSYFVENKLKFDEAEVYWIFVRNESIAGEIHLQIKEDNADFCRFARLYSEDIKTRLSGGFLGRLRRHQLPKGISPRVFASGPGEVLEPAKVAKGYALYMLQKFFPARLSDTVKEEIQNILFEIWIKKKMSRTEIQYPVMDLLQYRPVEHVPLSSKKATEQV